MNIPDIENLGKEEVLGLSKISSLCIELQDLKRQKPKGYAFSIAEQLFIEGWQRILAGEEHSQIAFTITAKALLSITLPGFESGFFKELNFEVDTVADILTGTLQTVVDKYELPIDTADQLQKALSHHIEAIATASGTANTIDDQHFEDSAQFVYDLIKQPRAGATNPNSSRMLLLPPESHADHCLITAVFAVLFASKYKADPGQSFLIAMSHHIHNAILPDMGFAGETALEKHLPYILDTSRKKALAKLPGTLQSELLHAIHTHENILVPEGEASAAADVTDRVLDIFWRLKASKISKEQLLDDLELIHPGPIQSFQNDFIKQLDLWSRL